MNAEQKKRRDELALIHFEQMQKLDEQAIANGNLSIEKRFGSFCYGYDAGFKDSEILAAKNAEIERLKTTIESMSKAHIEFGRMMFADIAAVENELAEKDAVLKWYAKMGHEKATEVLQKYRKSEG